jgi:hypothetical protein
LQLANTMLPEARFGYIIPVVSLLVWRTVTRIPYAILRSLRTPRSLCRSRIYCGIRVRWRMRDFGTTDDRDASADDRCSAARGRFAL